MPSSGALTAAQQTSTEVAWIYLLTITTPGSPDLLLCNDSQPVTSNGLTYEPYPFEVVLSADDGERVPNVQLRLAHIDGLIAHALRFFETAPLVKIELVTSATPDIVERSLHDAVMRSAQYDAFGVVANLELVNVLSAQFPSEAYTPFRFPTLFIP